MTKSVRGLHVENRKYKVLSDQVINGEIGNPHKCFHCGGDLRQEMDSSRMEINYNYFCSCEISGEIEAIRDELDNLKMQKKRLYMRLNDLMVKKTAEEAEATAKRELESLLKDSSISDTLKDKFALLYREMNKNT